MRLTLLKNEINVIKDMISFAEKRLIEDITDNEVFEYVRDIQEAHPKRTLTEIVDSCLFWY